MGKVNIMGINFKNGESLNVGSVRRINYSGVNDYILKSEDLEILDKIDTADGSTAFCTDTCDLYILHMGEWVKLGEKSTESTAQTQSVNLSPLSISREELTSSSGLNETEISDNLTVEPIVESLTGNTSSEELI